MRPHSSGDFFFNYTLSSISNINIITAFDSSHLSYAKMNAKEWRCSDIGKDTKLLQCLQRLHILSPLAGMRINICQHTANAWLIFLKNRIFTNFNPLPVVFLPRSWSFDQKVGTILERCDGFLKPFVKIIERALIHEHVACLIVQWSRVSVVSLLEQIVAILYVGLWLIARIKHKAKAVWLVENEFWHPTGNLIAAINALDAIHPYFRFQSRVTWRIKRCNWNRHVAHAGRSNRHDIAADLWPNE